MEKGNLLRNKLKLKFWNMTFNFGEGSLVIRFNCFKKKSMDGYKDKDLLITATYCTQRNQERIILLKYINGHSIDPIAAALKSFKVS